MALLQTPKFNTISTKVYNIKQPGEGGLYLNGLENELKENQSSDMLNLMYYNGALCKSYGRKFQFKTPSDYDRTSILAITEYKDQIIYNANTDWENLTTSIYKVIKNSDGTYTTTNIYHDVKFPTTGDVFDCFFFEFNKLLYYIVPGEAMYQYDGTTFSEVTPYVPDVIINRSPNPNATLQTTDTLSGDGISKIFTLYHSSLTDDAVTVKINGTTQSPSVYTLNRTAGTVTFDTAPASGTGNITVAYTYYKNNSQGDIIENFNRLGSGFKQTFHGDGYSTSYHLYSGTNGDFLPYDNTPIIVKVVENGVEVTKTLGIDYTFDRLTGIVTFTTAPVSGTNNVEITAYKTQQEYIDSIINCKYAKAYGGTNNSRLFLAGGGNSNYYFSDVFDASYFPENNYGSIGNTSEDITGFGEQYDTLIVFKPKEIISLSYYQDDDGIGHFSSAIVNGEIGCDCPKTIQTINNLLTWVSTEKGVCTLVSTAIENERNVKIISQNINTDDNTIDNKGLLSRPNYITRLKKARAVDHEGKYIVSLGWTTQSIGNTCEMYMWDYQISPYVSTSSRETDPKNLSWFRVKYDRWPTISFLKYKNDLYMSCGTDVYIFNHELCDEAEYNAQEQYIFTNKSVYTTPFLQFDAPTYLKTIKNLYVQVRAKTPVNIKIGIATEETPYNPSTGEIIWDQSTEKIVIGGKLWDTFAWSAFTWRIVNYANSFRRKISLKKFQMAKIQFVNDEGIQDMALTNIGFEYEIVKLIK